MWSHQVEKYCVLTKSTWILKHEWTFLQIFQTRCDLCCVCFCVCLYEKFLYKRKTKKYVSLTANLQDTLIRTRYVFDRKIGDKICDENLCVRAVCIYVRMCVLVWTISDLHKSTTQTHDGLIEHCIHNSKGVWSYDEAWHSDFSDNHSNLPKSKVQTTKSRLFGQYWPVW